MADRYAIVFLAVTLALAGAAWWLTGDAVRAVAVLVVATPCPLILAVPVAIVSGLSRAAKLGILIKGGRAIEMLARIRALVIDKTGTLTIGEAKIVATKVVRRLRAGRSAAAGRLARPGLQAHHRPDHRRRRAGAGSQTGDPGRGGGAGRRRRQWTGRRPSRDGRRSALCRSKVGGADLSELAQGRPPGALAVAVAVDGKLVGLMTLADELRAGTEQLLAALRALGIERIVLATGDRHDVAKFFSAGLSIDSGARRTHARPEDPGGAVGAQERPGDDDRRRRQRRAGACRRRYRSGDGRQGRGRQSAEAADVVLLVDQLDRVLPAIRIARRSRCIALQSVIAGIGLSIIAMVAAALGYLPPVEGALLQEVIDVAVIFNALRALRA